MTHLDAYGELRRVKSQDTSQSDPDMLQQLREQYPVGTRVALIDMDDPHAPPVGTQGTVEYVDALGTIHVSWDTGSCLGVVWEEDVIMKLE